MLAPDNVILCYRYDAPARSLSTLSSSSSCTHEYQILDILLLGYRYHRMSYRIALLWQCYRYNLSPQLAEGKHMRLLHVADAVSSRIAKFIIITNTCTLIHLCVFRVRFNLRYSGSIAHTYPTIQQPAGEPVHSHNFNLCTSRT